jgi:hypothetical protein
MTFSDYDEPTNVTISEDDAPPRTASHRPRQGKRADQALRSSSADCYATSQESTSGTECSASIGNRAADSRSADDEATDYP